MIMFFVSWISKKNRTENSGLECFSCDVGTETPHLWFNALIILVYSPEPYFQSRIIKFKTIQMSFTGTSTLQKILIE